jgi:hypothetical protein
VPLFRVHNGNRSNRRDNVAISDADAFSTLRDEGDDIGWMSVTIVAMAGKPRLEQPKVAEARMAPELRRFLYAFDPRMSNLVQDDLFRNV